MQTSILDRLCDPLCDAVTGNHDGEAMLAHLQQANLFVVPLDDEHYWYRYHHLFADLLGQRLRKEMSAPEIAELHRRAGAWHEANGSIAEAVKHALVADEPKRAANLVEQNLSRMTTGGELSTLLDWINELPEELIHSRPVLCIPRAWALVFAGRFDGVESLLQAAERHLPPAGPEQPSQALAPYAGLVLRGNIATIRAFIADRTGDGSRAMELAQLADELLPPGDLMSRSLVPYILGRAYRTTGDLMGAARAASEMVRIGRAAGNEMTTVMGMCEQATLYKLWGQLRRASDLYRQAQQLKIEQGELNFVTWALVDVGLADLLIEQNELVAARQRLERVVHNLEEMSWGGAPTDLVLAYTTLTRVLTAQGDLADASAALQKAESARQHHNDFPGFKGVIASCQVELWLARGELDQAIRWSQRFTGEDKTGGALLTDELEQIALARVRVAEGRTKEAHNLLARLAEVTAAGGRQGRHIQVLVLQALALYAQKKTAGAIAALEKALSLAEPEGYVRVFVDGGQPMAELLRAVSSRGLLPDYVSQLLAQPGMQDTGQQPAISPPLQPASLVEPLSERELEVLHLISAGHSNQEIAARLVVTLNTVKKHTSNIYGKLEVNSRTQAIARARELGLIP
jgi:LuxR family maltose regulon positive regulatory protein